MHRFRSPLVGFFASLLIICAAAYFGPEEQTLGAGVRVVYLHGAWVLTAEIAYFAAAAAGALGLAARLLPRLDPAEERLHRFSTALGRTGVFFWVTYLPLSLWAMNANWNGLFLAEPRFRLALTFAVVGVLLQIGLWVVNIPWIASAANLIFFVALRVVFSRAAYVMHPPPSPIFGSGNPAIIVFFILLNLLTLVAAGFLTVWILRHTPSRMQSSPV